MRDILTALEADEEIGNFEEEVAIIEEIAEVLKHIKTSYQLLEIYQRRSYLRKLLRFKTHNITNISELFYAGAVVVTKRLAVFKINKVSKRKEPVWRKRLQNKIKEKKKDLCQLKSSKDNEFASVRHWQTLLKNTVLE